MTRVVIDLTLAHEMVQTITGLIEERLFGKDMAGIRLIRIRQNVLYAITALLGREIRSDRIRLYCEEYAASHIRAVVRVGESVGIIAAQSINQPVTQAVLKSQHRAGNKESTGTNSLIALNSMTVRERIIKFHLLPEAAEYVTQESLAQYLEEVRLEDVLSPVYGSSRFEPISVNTDWPEDFSGGIPADFEDHSQSPLYFYVNHRFMRRNELVYRFRIDPSKLGDAGLTQSRVYDILFSLRGVMVVIHPLSSFTFDIVPGDKPLTAFLELIKTLMRTSLKGIPGLESVNERKVEPVSYKGSDGKQVEGLVRQEHYETGSDTTWLYLDPVGLMHFPIEELKKRIINADGTEPTLISEVTRIYHDSESEGGSLFHLAYRGRVTVKRIPYVYYIFTGSLTLTELLNYDLGSYTLSEICDTRHILSNDPIEMIELIGRTGARTVHEYNYSEELVAGKTPLLYQHITLICRRMLGIGNKPIGPASYMADTRPNALDKLGYQNYRQNFERESIRGIRSTVNDLPSAVIVGRRPVLGTNAIETEVDSLRRQEVIALYAEARRRQQYFGDYEGIEFQKLGEVTPLTRIPPKPFGEGFLVPGRAKGL